MLINLVRIYQGVDLYFAMKLATFTVNSATVITHASVHTRQCEQLYSPVWIHQGYVSTVGNWTIPGTSRSLHRSPLLSLVTDTMSHSQMKSVDINRHHVSWNHNEIGRRTLGFHRDQNDDEYCDNDEQHHDYHHFAVLFLMFGCFLQLFQSWVDPCRRLLYVVVYPIQHRALQETICNSQDSVTLITDHVLKIQSDNEGPEKSNFICNFITLSNIQHHKQHHMLVLITCYFVCFCSNKVRVTELVE